MFPHLIKLVGPYNSDWCDLKYNLENILNPRKSKNEPIINNIIEIEQFTYIVSFNHTTGILNSLYNHLYKDTEARLIISKEIYYTITFLNEFLHNELPKPWMVEAPFRHVEYGLLYKGRSYINWVVEHTESMELEYIF
jgi:hypothetical protein